VSLSVAFLRQLAQSIARAGVDPEEFLRAVTVEPETSAEDFVSIRRAERALAQLGRRVGDPVFGLTLARLSPMGSLGAFDYAVWASGTLREAIARSARIYEFVCRGVVLEFEVRSDAGHVTLRTPPGITPGVILPDFTLGIHVVRLRETLGDSRLLSVSLCHGAPATDADADAYETFFGVRPAFDAPTDSLAFDATYVDRPLRTANAPMVGLIEAHAVETIARLQPVDGLLGALRGAVVRRLRSDDLDLSSLAADLKQSPRTLQRHLQNRGTSLRDVIDAVRRELAVSMLADRGASSALVAQELGFSSSQAFVRAFERWAGMTPAQFRASRRAGP
jgi:AraC-like DNA-binding protein